MDPSIADNATDEWCGRLQACVQTKLMVDTRVVRILRTQLANSVHIFLADFSILKLSVALLYDLVCHTSI